MEIEQAITLAVPAILGVVWMVRLEGRINVQAVKTDAAEKRVDGLEQQILDRLKRIEDKLDAHRN